MAEGLSIREIGLRLGLSPTAVRHWLAKYNLSTVRAGNRRSVRIPVAELDPGVGIEAKCPRHGMALHRLRPDSGLRCLRCRSESVTRRRRKVKRALVEDAGGRCALCGYSRSHAALVFHHLDPAHERFGLAHRGVTRSLAVAREEAQKCLLLCANCHAEVEAGVTPVPTRLAQVGPG